MNYHYCCDFNTYKRFPTRKVKIGVSSIGGDAPIRIQSMTNTDTLNTEKSVAQSISIIKAGADFVRFTVQTQKHAENLRNIKNELRNKAYEQPLIADVHFNPKVAEVSAQIIEKVRINPGNFVDINKVRQKSYSEQEYLHELDKIKEKFVRLINICKKHKTAIRIGANHGSLSSRIVDKYGDTPKGMVESVMEFLRIARLEDFHEIIISLKSSNTRVMVFAYRLLMQQMIAENMNYPLHLGVTEAGDGEDGRIKSAVGIGSLLIDGLGDTIRVSLTENPEKEIPVAKKILHYIALSGNHEVIKHQVKCLKNPYEYSKRTSYAVDNIGADNVPVVIADLSNYSFISKKNIRDLGFEYIKQWQRNDLSPDYILINEAETENFKTDGLKLIYNYKNSKNKDYLFFDNINIFLKGNNKAKRINFIAVDNDTINFKLLKQLKKLDKVVLILHSKNKNTTVDKRTFIHQLINLGINIPVISFGKYDENSIENFQINAALEHGLLLIDGLIDGIILQQFHKNLLIDMVKTAFGILQASRSRITKTEYISCPSCGRTLFDIQNVTKEIKLRTANLKGIKIGIMGCIVNGPGEMADADYGYVGTGHGLISLYKGQKIIKKNIDYKKAVDELIMLIKKDGHWKE